MKLYGMGGVGTGKVGSMVYSVRNGQQIVRQYNPIVANPSTTAQVEARSKLKLMSQLAAIVAPVIAIPSDGLKSKRNEFISRNYGLTGYEEETATIALEGVQLTKSNTAMIDFVVDRSNGETMAIQLKENANNVFDRVVYCAVIRQSDGSLRLFDSVIVQEGGTGGLFPATLPYTPNAVAVYGYGIRANNDDAKAAYANLKSNEAGKLAQILTTRNATLEAVTISETKGAVLEIGQTSSESMSANSCNIAVAVQGTGTVTGAGVKTIGSQVTLTATAGENYAFVGFYNGNQLLSASSPYVFTASEDLNLTARFSYNGGTGGPNGD